MNKKITMEEFVNNKTKLMINFIDVKKFSDKLLKKTKNTKFTLDILFTYVHEKEWFQFSYNKYDDYRKKLLKVNPSLLIPSK